MKISAEVREQAADLCAIAASNRGVAPADAETSLLGTNKNDSSSPWGLAWDSIDSVDRHFNPRGSLRKIRLIYAEAEARLRTGWTP